MAPNHRPRAHSAVGPRARPRKQGLRARIAGAAIAADTQLCPPRAGMVFDAADEAGQLVHLLTLILPLARRPFPEQATMMGASYCPPHHPLPDPHFRVAALSRLRVPLPFRERAAKVSSDAGAIGIAVRAALAAESSPKWASAAALSARRCASSSAALARDGPGTSLPAATSAAACRSRHCPAASSSTRLSSSARGTRVSSRPRYSNMRALRDPERRPPTRQVPLPPDFRSSHPRDPLALNSQRFLRNLRSGRRGAAAGPSGCTAEHLRVLADDEASADLLLRAAKRLANADVPADVLAGVRLGRMVGLRKPDGGVRGLVMSDAFRRLVARTLAQQYAGAFQAACAPFQYALRTRAGAESLARAVRAATELDARTTVLSIDGVGAYDHISRASMLSGLQHTPSLTALLPFVAQFYAEPSTYVFYDAEGAAHEIAQGEGGEQGDPLMPALFALGQHPALLQAHAALAPGEDLYAYLDDIYVTCQPGRAGPAFTALGTALWERANIRVHLGKTRAWNAAGEEPSALLDALPAAARADAWAGSWARPPAQQGITVLGTPLGHAAYIAGALRRVREKHDELLGRIPTVPHLQSAWLLLLLCAQPGAITCSAYCRPLTQLPTDVGDAYASAPLEGDVLSDARWAPGA